MIPAPGSVRGLFFCPSGCPTGCSCRQARRTRPALTIARDPLPRPSCAVLGALGGTPAPLTIPPICAVRLIKALWRILFACGHLPTGCSKSTLHAVYGALSGISTRSLRTTARFLTDPPGPSPKTRQNRPNPGAFSRRIRAVFRYVFVRIFIGFLL